MQESIWTEAIAAWLRIVSRGRFPHAVAHSAHCFDEGRAEFAAETCDEDLDGVGIPVEILRVDVLSELGPRHDSSAMVHQIREHAELMAGQLHRGAADRHASGARVKSQRAAPKFGMGKPACAADQSSNACKDLFDPEWLGNVVVRPAVDPLYFFMPASAGGQNEHGREDAHFPPPAKQGESVYFRQSEVEYNRVILLRVAEEIGLFPVGRAVDGIAGVGERFRQLP